MNFHQKIITILCAVSCSIGIVACSEKESNHGEKPATVESKETPSAHPLPEFDQTKTLAPEPSRKKEVQKSEQEQIAQVLLEQSEGARAIVFDVPLGEAASLDRVKAWESLTQKEPWMLLSDAQCEYARDLLKRYENGTQLERLVFWRLVFLRKYEQGASGTSRVVGADQELRRDLRKRLLEMLYSGLGSDPEELSEPLAARKAMELLEKAAKKDD
jgi:hypothetical protein